MINKFKIIILYIFFYLIFVFIFGSFFSQSVIAKPILSFNEIQSYKLNDIQISNLNFEKNAIIKVIAYTYDKKKELIFYSKLRYNIKSFDCIFYVNPDFEKVELIIILDSDKKYEYQFTIKPNKEAEKDFEKYSFNEKYNYEIVNPMMDNSYIKIPNEFNPFYYNLLTSAIINYFDKKEIDKYSIFLLVSILLFFSLIILFIQNKRFTIIVLAIVAILSCYYIIFYNSQNFILKAYIENPLKEENKTLNKTDPLITINIPIQIDKNIEIDYKKFLFFNLITSKSSTINIFQNVYTMQFSKFFFQNSKIPIKGNFENFFHFVTQPKIFCITYEENNGYYINLNKLMVFGRLLNENKNK